jgi:hypothetical protein
LAPSGAASLKAGPTPASAAGFNREPGDSAAKYRHN